jgi:hypothetical protein
MSYPIILRKTSTIPFGYKESNKKGYLEPIVSQLNFLEIAEFLIICGMPLRRTCKWLHIKSGKSITAAGLKKIVDRKYGSIIHRSSIIGSKLNRTERNDIISKLIKEEYLPSCYKTLLEVISESKWNPDKTQYADKKENSKETNENKKIFNVRIK